VVEVVVGVDVVVGVEVRVEVRVGVDVGVEVRVVVKIEKDIPIPEKQFKSSRYNDVIAEMSNGDSVIFDYESEANSFYVAITRAGYLATRRTENGKFRVWKLERKWMKK